MSGAAPDLGRLEALVFDLDGTLADSFAGIAASVNHARAALGRPPLAVAEVKGMVGHGLDRLIAQAFAPAEVARAKEIFLPHYEATAAASTPAMPGAEAALTALAGRGLKLGVATNKPSRAARQILAAMGLDRHLQAVLGADEVRELKPHPEMLTRALDLLGVAASRALYVGDLAVDVETGRQAGVEVAVVAAEPERRQELLRAGAALAVGGLEELARVVLAGIERGVGSGRSGP
jgi:phosphoglycolate phosphatase